MCCSLVLPAKLKKVAYLSIGTTHKLPLFLKQWHHTRRVRELHVPRPLLYPVVGCSSIPVWEGNGLGNHVTCDVKWTEGKHTGVMPNCCTIVSWKAPMGKAPYKSAKEGRVGSISSASAFNYERVPMSCFQQLNALKANMEPPEASKSSSDTTQHSQQHHV